MSPSPKLGPDPTIISRKEVDALYETLSEIQRHLGALNIRFIVTGGSLLGAIRQHSILFCDDDIDIAIIDEDGAYQKARDHLPLLLSDDYQYQIEPWPGGDRVRPRKMNNVFVDIFSLRRYNSEEELVDVIGRKVNGQSQSDDYVNGILQTIREAAYSQGERSELYPCWQFATRKAIEMWPKEIYRESELFPLSTVKMGPIINLSGPRTPVLLLKRFFGRDCFEVYYQSVSHQTNGNGTNDFTHQDGSTTSLPPLTYAGGTWEKQTKQPLEAQHYVPMQPTTKSKRRLTDHNQSALFEYLNSQIEWENAQLGIHSVDEQINICPDQNAHRTIYMDGVFDLFHIGHLRAIEECAKLGRRVIIGVTGDDDATDYKRKPVMDQEERTSIVAALKMVDEVICPCPLVVTEEFMDEHKIDLVVHGFANEADAQKQTEFFGIAMELGKFQQIPYTSGVSTTERIKTLSNKPTQQPAKPQWFGSCISEATNKSSAIPFNPFPLDLRIVMEPHLNKALQLRTDSLAAIRTATSLRQYDKVLSEFQSSPLFSETEFHYNVDEYNIRQHLLQCLCNGHECIDLSRLHDESSISKEILFQALISSHHKFQQVYDDFVREVCIPKMAGKETFFYYQSFPCLRINQPGEFSIGPHADVNYGHHPCSINCYVLLTDIEEANSSSILFLESAPNRQDWHPIVGKYGKVHCFPGALSTHWTTDNNTHTTRVSLDFRIIPGSLYDSLKCGGSVPGGKKDVYRAKKGYYNMGCKAADGVWIRKQALHSPLGDPRFGYPWTRSSTKSSGVQVVHPQRP
jgi:choline-phosphate cytidylyltransferase